MGKQIINVGSTGNDGTGDDLRTAGNKINQNFDELFLDVKQLQVFTGTSSTSYGVYFDSNQISFEGTTADSFETALTIIDPTKDNLIKLPDSSGTLVLDTNIAAVVNSAAINIINATVDSNYIAVRTGVAMDSGATLLIVKANSVDSADVIQLIDSAYVLSRSPAGADSAQIMSVVDSALGGGEFSNITTSRLVVDTGATQGFGAIIKSPYNIGNHYASLLVGGDGDPAATDILFEVRGNTNGSLLDTTNGYNSTDTRFAVLGDGDIIIGGAATLPGGIDSAGTVIRNSSKLSVYGDATVDRLWVNATDSGGIRFPDNAYGGSGDTAKIYLTTDSTGGENLQLTLEMANDAHDEIHLRTPSDNGVKINDNTVLHHGNAGNLFDSDFVQARAVEIDFRNYEVATVPNSPPHGNMIFVNNGNSGAPCIAVYDSDAGYYRRIALGTQIST